MNSLAHHIHRVKAQPHHIRKQVGFGIALGIAGVIGVAWAGISLGTGAFALKDTSSFATAGESSAQVAATNANPNLAAAAAADTAFPPSSTTAHIEIVDAKPAAAPAAQPTSIPF